MAAGGSDFIAAPPTTLVSRDQHGGAGSNGAAGAQAFGLAERLTLFQIGSSASTAWSQDAEDFGEY